METQNQTHHPCTSFDVRLTLKFKPRFWMPDSNFPTQNISVTVGQVAWLIQWWGVSCIKWPCLKNQTVPCSFSRPVARMVFTHRTMASIVLIPAPKQCCWLFSEENKMWGPVMAVVAMMMAEVVLGQNRRPTISFITQPEIVADIGGDVSCNHYQPSSSSSSSSSSSWWTSWSSTSSSWW